MIEVMLIMTTKSIIGIHSGDMIHTQATLPSAKPDHLMKTQMRVQRSNAWHTPRAIIVPSGSLYDIFC